MLLTSTHLNTTLAAPPLSEEDVFNSHPQLGAIAYRLPSISELFQLPGDMFDHFSTLTFYVSVQSGKNILQCASDAINNCRVIYRQDYSPALYYISPRVLYNSADVELIFDPRSTLRLIRDLEVEELPFINGKIGRSLIDFD